MGKRAKIVVAFDRKKASESGLRLEKENKNFVLCFAFYSPCTTFAHGMGRRIRQVIDWVMTPVSKNPVFYIAVILLFSISIIFVIYGRCSRMRAGLEMFADVYVLCLLMMLVPRKWRTPAKGVVFALLYIIGVTDMVCFQVMGTALLPNVVQTWMQTNMQEATEAVGFYLSPRLLATPLSLLLLLPFAIHYLRKKKPTLPQSLVTLLLVITLASAVYGITNKRYLLHVYSRVSDDDMKEFVDFDTMTREYLPVYRLALSFKEIHRFSKMRKHLARNVRATRVEACSFRSPVIVLIIGESYNRHHASLYGYDKSTTPLQQRRMENGKNGRLFRFDDVIASYNLTFKSFQNMLTLYDYDEKGLWYDYPVVPAIFKKAGYEVDFFSNQFTLDKKSAFSDFTEDVFMNNDKLNPYLFDKRNAESHPYDMDLIDDYLNTCDTAATTPRLVIFHFMGLHADYQQRYTDDYAIFDADDYDRPDLDEEQKQILASYDNAIRYNDAVVDAIVRTFEQKDAIVIYVPDHGELVYDGGQEYGRNLQLTSQVVIPQYDIPFWIYCTQRYMDNHPDLCRQIEQSVHRPFMTDDLPHLLLDLAGISCKEYQPGRNLIDDQFDTSRKRRIRGEADYDELIKKTP